MACFFGSLNGFSNGLFINSATPAFCISSCLNSLFFPALPLTSSFSHRVVYLKFNSFNTRSNWLVVAAKLRTFLCTPNKTLLALPSVAGTLTRGLAHFVRIVAHALAPQSLALGVIYLQQQKVGSAVTLQHQGCFARLPLLLTFSDVSTTLATRFLSTQ